MSIGRPDFSEKQQAICSMHPGGLNLTGRAVRLAGITPDMVLLDVGCGVGLTLEYLVRKFEIIGHGIDISEKHINIAAERFPEAMYSVGTALRMPYESGFFDTVICECVLSVIEESKIVIHEMHRVLRIGGTLIVSDVCDENDIHDVEAMFTKAGFMITKFEEHKAALTTYVAEAYAAGECSRCNGKVAEKVLMSGNKTYYLLICQRSE